MNLRWIGLPMIAAASLVTSSCALTSNEMSCSLINATTKKIEKCIEYTDFSAAGTVSAKASLALLCKAFSAKIDNDLCDTTDALVGCVKSTGGWTQTEWNYSVAGSPDDTTCGSDEIKLGPDRKPLVSADMAISSDLSTAHDLAKD